MKISVNEDKVKNELTLIPEGCLSVYTDKELRDVLDSAIRGSWTRVIVDLHKVVAISSSGFQTFIDARNKLICEARDFVITGVSEEVAFEMRFPDLMRFSLWRGNDMYGLDVNKAPVNKEAQRILMQWGLSLDDFRSLPVTRYDDYLESMVRRKAPVLDIGKLLEPIRLFVDPSQTWILEFEYDKAFYGMDELPDGVPASVLLSTAEIRRLRTDILSSKKAAL